MLLIVTQKLNKRKTGENGHDMNIVKSIRHSYIPAHFSRIRVYYELNVNAVRMCIE